MPALHALEAYTVILLKHADHYLLLQRSQRKSFAPNRWTGVGGHVEPGEHSDLDASALRELYEETGLSQADVQHFTLRRVLLTNRPGQPLGIVLYYTGILLQPVLPDCPEGRLAWKRAEAFAPLDIIETTRPVLDCLVEDIQRDPSGSEPVKTGLGVFGADGGFQRVVWGDGYS